MTNQAHTYRLQLLCVTCKCIALLNLNLVYLPVLGGPAPVSG